MCKRDTELHDIGGLLHHDIVNCPCFKEINPPAIPDLRDNGERGISDEELLELAHAMFDENRDSGHGAVRETESPASMEEVLEMLEETEHTLGKPPEDFDMEMFLLSSKGQTLPGNEANFGSDKNDAVDSAIKNIDKFSGLIQIVWYKICLTPKTFKREHSRCVIFHKEVKKLLPTIS